MQKILIVTPEYSYRGIKGYQRVIDGLISAHPFAVVDIVSFDTAEYHENAPDNCRMLKRFRVTRIRQIVNAISSLFRFEPIQSRIYFIAEAKRYIQNICYYENYDLIIVNTIRCSFSSNPHMREAGLLNHIDDVSRSCWSRFYTSALYYKPMYLYEAIASNRFVKRQSANFKLHGFVSKADVTRHSSRLLAVKLPYATTVPYIQYTLSSTRVPDSIVFCGNLGYSPNSDGLIWFIRRVFPLIIRSFPKAQLHIVGSRPSKKLTLICTQIHGIHLHVNVPSVISYLTKFKVSIAPVFNPVGIQTKIIDSFACGIPVVSTVEANEGISALDRVEILVSRDPEEFAKNVIILFRSDSICDRIARNGLNLCNREFRPNKESHPYKELQEIKML